MRVTDFRELQRTLNNEAWFQLREGNYAEGAELLLKCIAVRPEIGDQTAPYYRNLVISQLCLGEYSRAEEIERKLIAFAKGDIVLIDQSRMSPYWLSYWLY